MPVIETDKLIKEFYATIKERYPDMSLRECEDICKAAFYFTRRSMAREDMPTVYIRFFGKFVVLSSRLKRMLVTTENQRKFNRISDQEYYLTKELLLERLKKITDDQNQSLEIDEG